MLVPMFFVPLGHLKSRDWFRRDRLSPLQQELLKRALTHGLRQSRSMLNDFFDWEGNHTKLYRGAFRGFIEFLEMLAKMHGLTSEPRTRDAKSSTRTERPTACRFRRFPSESKTSTHASSSGKPSASTASDRRRGRGRYAAAYR